MEFIKRCVLLIAFLPRTQAANREYFVRAEEVLWDFGPSGRDLMTGVDFENHADADVFMVNRPHKGQIGRQYWKAIYEEYTDASFTVKKTRPKWAGLLGPTLYCEVGDRMVISFQNNCTKALTMHPHGVKYNKPSEGAPYYDGSDGRGDHVQPGETYTYLWTCDEHSGPGPSDGSSVAWPYHSHNPSRVDSNSGLVGIIVITRRGDADANARPKDVDAEFVVYMSVVDENKNYLLDRNIDEFIVQRGRNLTDSEREHLKADAHFEEGNLMHGINGRLYGNLDGFDIQAGQRVRFYVFALGTEADLHAAHWKGHSVLYRGQRTSVLQLMAGVSSVADMVPTQAGQWGMYCHTNDHIVGGMITTYNVLGSDVLLRTTGRTRHHYIQAEEVVWDFGPSNHTLYDTSLDSDEHAQVFFENDPSGGRIGGMYLKCLYQGYTDATFTTRLPRPVAEQHLGMLGPLIRAEVGDTIEVVYSNKCTKPTSINVPAVLKPKSHEGWHYRDALDKGMQQSGVVPSNEKHTYVWQVIDGPGPFDLSSIGFVYNSHQPMPTDTNSGLVGPLIITGFGQADSSGKPLDVVHEVVTLLTVTDEGSSYLLDRNIDMFILQRGGGQTDAEIESLKEDDDFLESNLMHGINGRLFGNMEPPRLAAGEKTRVYAMAVGTEVDLHSLRLSGHSFLVRGERRAQLNLMPGEVVEADILPTMGTWAVYCQTNDHLVGGMIGQFLVTANALDDPLTVKRQVGKTRYYYLQAEEVYWDYGVTGTDQTGQYFSRLGNAKPVAWEDGDGELFMANKPHDGFIGRVYKKCLFRGYDSTFSVKEDRSPGSKWEHLGVLGPIIHAEEGDVIEVILRNNCSIPVSIHPQIAHATKDHEGFQYKDAGGASQDRAGDAVQPGESFTYRWHVLEGPGPRDGSSIGTMYYSMANGMAIDTYSGLKGPLVITRKGFANSEGKPKDVDTELVLMFEVTNEGESYLLDHNFNKYVLAKGGKQSDDADAFEESNLMHGINGQLYANLRGLTASAETKVRWYVLSLGTEVDLHSVHWHAHTVLYGGHRLDVVMNMPATGITADMYVDNVGTWLMHCHVNDHIEGGMTAVYEVLPNPDRGEGQISTCQQMYSRSADLRRESFNFSSEHFHGYVSSVMLSPYFKLGYTVDRINERVNMIMAARTTGWLGLGFFHAGENKDHAMINTDMIVGRVKDGVPYIDDSYAQGLETPKFDTTLGASDQLSNKEGFEENGVTYIKFTRSFREQDTDSYDFLFKPHYEQIHLVYAYSSIDSDNLVYHGPTRGYAKMAWNTNCSSNHFFSLLTSSCEGCDQGYYRLAFDTRFSFTRCERCPKGTIADMPGDRRSHVFCEPCGINHGTSLFPGSASHEDCVCLKGYYHPCKDEDCSTSAYTKAQMLASKTTFCLPCPKGMACEGGIETDLEEQESLVRRHKQPIVPSGSFSPLGVLSVYKCRNDPRQCPGGALGSCAKNRKGIQCGECLEGFYASDHGTCRKCGGGDAVPFVFAVVFMIVALIVMYHAVATEDKSSKSHSMLLVTVSGSQMITALQMLAAVGNMSFNFAEPFSSLLKFVQIFNFNIEILRLECVVSPSPLGLLVGKIMIVVAMLVYLCVVHVFHVLLFYKAAFRNRMPALLAVLGTMLMAFFISTTSTVFSPLQCSEPHPNGKSTLKGYPTVVCWDSDGEHSAFLAVGLASSIIPLGALVAAFWVVTVYPQKLRKGDTEFMRSYAFLIFRFNGKCTWYVVVFMLRNLLLSVVPAIPDAVIQLATMFLILQTTLCVVIFFRPWRVSLANALDAFINTAMLMVVCMSGMFVEEVNEEIIAIFCAIILGALSVLIPAAVLYGLAQNISHRGTKPFSLFLCHHKAGCGAMARLLKMILTGEKLVKKKVFLDNDDLTDLGRLFDYVGSQTETFVLMCSAEILKRPWCMGEVVTAQRRNVPVTRIFFPDFVQPDVEFIAKYHEFVPDYIFLAEHGISLAMVCDMLRWLPSLPATKLPLVINPLAIRELTVRLGTQKQGAVVEISQKSESLKASMKVVIILDNTNYEAVATGIILSRLLIKHFTHDPEFAPIVLSHGMKLPSSIKKVVIICTNGVFRQEQVLQVLWQAANNGLSHVPILAEEHFRFPSKSLLQEIEPIANIVTEHPAALLEVIKCVFKEIALTFQPENCTAEILETKAIEVSRRLTRREGGLLRLNTGLVSEHASEQDDAAAALDFEVPKEEPVRLAEEQASVEPLAKSQNTFAFLAKRPAAFVANEERPVADVVEIIF